MISTTSRTAPLVSNKPLRGAPRHFSYMDEYHHPYGALNRKAEYTYRKVEHNHRFTGLNHKVQVIAPIALGEEMHTWCTQTLGRHGVEWARTHTGFFFHTCSQAMLFIMTFKGRDD